MRPGNALQLPFITRKLLRQLFCHGFQHRVIVRRFVLADIAPVQGLSGQGKSAESGGDARIKLLRVGKPLLHEGDPREAHFQTRAEPILRQIAFDAITLDPAGVRYDNGWRPVRFESFEISRMFFDVSCQRNKRLVDEVRSFLIRVGLGFQPSTCASNRRGRKVD